MSPETSDNPFSDFGGIVRGDRFIGRKEDLRVIEARVLRPTEPGNLAIIGEPRVGKSSLMYRGVMDRKEELVARRRLPIWLNVATFDRAEMLFRSLVLEASDQIEDLGWMTPAVERARGRALEKTAVVLEEEGSLPKLLQILFGPVVDVTEVVVDDLLRYGLLQGPSPDGSYQGFSRHFEQYLKLVARDVDLWPLWSRTERELRALVSEHLVEKYGERWPEKPEKARPKLKAMLDACRDNQSKEQRTFGARASTNLLDFTYPDDLYQIMRTDWSWFQPALGRGAGEWQPAFEVLSRVRTPLAHNRDATVYQSDRLKAQGFCHEILARIETWQRNPGG